MSKPAVLEVSVLIAAAPEDVFPYFTDPARHVGWMGSEAELEPVPGGPYCLRMGDGFGVCGTFQEIRSVVTTSSSHHPFLQAVPARGAAVVTRTDPGRPGNWAAAPGRSRRPPVSVPDS
jgi:uncharacterized protein YndB with AHSA1/START domain